MTAATLFSELAVRGLVISAHAATITGDGAPPEWICIMPAGTFRGVDGRGPFTLKDPAAVIAASLKDRGMVALDYNHQTIFACLKGGTAPAAAWIDRMEVRDGAIWGRLVDWTPEGAQAVASKSYRFVSPAFQHDKTTGEVRRIDSVGLVNNPNLAELPAIASQTGDHMDELLQALRSALGLPADADQNAIIQCCRQFRGTSTTTAAALLPLATTLGLAANASIEGIVKAAQDKLATGAPDPAKFVPMSAFAELQGKVAELTGAAVKGAADKAVADAMAAGKVTPALKDWALAYAAKDPDGFAGWVKAAPAIVIPGGNAPSGGLPPGSAAVPDEAAQAVCAALGISMDAFKKEAAKETAR
jgi:phage I-like protein